MIHQFGSTAEHLMIFHFCHDNGSVSSSRMLEALNRISHCKKGILK